MNFIQALILGVIEGITEFLPISSTAHLILASHLLGIPQTDFVKSFEIAIQLGAILAVVVLYARMLLQNLAVVKHVIAAFIPTAIIGLLAYKFVKEFLLESETLVLWTMALGGIAIIIFEVLHNEKKNAVIDIAHISYGKAATIGIFQSIAMIPGISRSAVTVMGGLLCGLTRKTVIEFSFLLAIPTMAAATGLDLLKNFNTFSTQQLDVLAIGFLSAFLTALLAIRFLLRFIKTHTFLPFGIYRVAAAFLFLLFL